MEPVRHKSLWHMIAAPIVWALHFCVVYAWTASVCAHTDDASEARVGVAVITVIALTLIVFFGWRAWKQWNFMTRQKYVHDQPTTEHRKEFLGHAGWLLSIVSVIGVAFVAAPAFYIGSCL